MNARAPDAEHVKTLETLRDSGFIRPEVFETMLQRLAEQPPEVAQWYEPPEPYRRDPSILPRRPSMLPPLPELEMSRGDLALLALLVVMVIVATVGGMLLLR